MEGGQCLPEDLKNNKKLNKKKFFQLKVRSNTKTNNEQKINPNLWRVCSTPQQLALYAEVGMFVPIFVIPI